MDLDELRQKRDQLIKVGRYDEALKYAKTIVTSHSQLAGFDDWFAKGLCHFHLDEEKEAGEAYTQALRFDPQNLQAMTNKGISLLNLRRIAEAVTLFRHILNRDPNIGAAWYNLGIYFLRLDYRMDWSVVPDAFMRARNCFRRLLTLMPEMGKQWVPERREEGAVRLESLPSSCYGELEELSVEQILAGHFPEVEADD